MMDDFTSKYRIADKTIKIRINENLQTVLEGFIALFGGWDAKVLLNQVTIRRQETMSSGNTQSRGLITLPLDNDMGLVSQGRVKFSFNDDYVELVGTIPVEVRICKACGQEIPDENEIAA